MKRRIAIGLLGGLAILVLSAGLISIGTWPAHAQTTIHLALSSGAGAPNASGMINLTPSSNILQGVAQGKGLPAQAFGSGRFYVWFGGADLRIPCYPPTPTIIGDDVGAADPVSGSIVMAKVFASTPAGSGGLITVALPCVSGLKTPAGIGAPLVGINHSS